MCSIESNFDDQNQPQADEQGSLSYDDLSRRDARSLIFHLLYAVEAFEYQESLEAVVDNFNRGFGFKIPQDSEIFKITNAVITNRKTLDKMYQPLLANWRLERVSVCAKLILRFGVWELHNTTIDQRIIINEAIELTKCFAEAGAYRFINGILDRIAKEKKLV